MSKRLPTSVRWTLILVMVTLTTAPKIASTRSKEYHVGKVGFEPCDKYIRFLECYIKLLPARKIGAFHARYRWQILGLKRAYVREGSGAKAKKNIIRRCIAAFDMARNNLDSVKVKRCLREVKKAPRPKTVTPKVLDLPPPRVTKCVRKQPPRRRNSTAPTATGKPRCPPRTKPATFVDANQISYFYCELPGKTKHGPLLSYHPNGRRRGMGAFTNGLKSGMWHEWYSNGKRSHKGAYLKGKTHGTWLLYHEKGQLGLEEHYDNGARHGKSTFWYKNGNILKILFYVKGKKHGALKEWYTNGKRKIVEYWTNGVPNGPAVLWYNNGYKRMEGAKKYGKKHGQFVYYYPSGTLYQVFNYKNGVREGKVIQFDRKRRVTMGGQYRNGKHHGPWKNISYSDMPGPSGPSTLYRMTECAFRNGVRGYCRTVSGILNRYFRRIAPNLPNIMKIDKMLKNERRPISVPYASSVTISFAKRSITRCYRPRSLLSNPCLLKQKISSVVVERIHTKHGWLYARAVVKTKPVKCSNRQLLKGYTFRRSDFRFVRRGSKWRIELCPWN